MGQNPPGPTTAFGKPRTVRGPVATDQLDGAHVKKGEPYCVIEVMKMFMPLKVEESGVLSWNSNEGAAIAAGDLLATLELDNPENVSTVSVCAVLVSDFADFDREMLTSRLRATSSPRS